MDNNIQENQDIMVTGPDPKKIIRTEDDRYGDVVISAYDLHKNFKIYFDKGNQLKEKLLFTKRNRYELHHVLKGLNFEIRRGEAWGLIGENGCGKSTTLKLLTRIMYPDQGEVHVAGRVSSMLELGAGFHPDMSGRENIYTNAAIFGLSRKDIDERIDDIIQFSELGKYIDNPVRTYSSGMYLRLAFSVAINVNAEILFIDEILAVGDANFQSKCFNRLREIKASGTTIVIVSHNLGQIEQICNKTLWLKDGNILAAGPPREVHPKYLQYMSQKRQETMEREQEEKKKKEAEKAAKQKAEPKKEKTAGENDAAKKWEGFKNRWGSREIEMTGITLRGDDGKPKNLFGVGENIKLTLDYKVNSPVKNADFGFGIYRGDGLHIYGTNTRIDQFKDFDISESGHMTLDLKGVNLLAGQYNVDVAIQGFDGKPIDFYKNAAGFEVYSIYRDQGTVRIDHKWDISSMDIQDETSGKDPADKEKALPDSGAEAEGERQE